MTSNGDNFDAVAQNRPRHCSSKMETDVGIRKNIWNVMKDLICVKFCNTLQCIASLNRNDKTTHSLTVLAVFVHRKLVVSSLNGVGPRVFDVLRYSLHFWNHMLMAATSAFNARFNVFPRPGWASPLPWAAARPQCHDPELFSCLPPDPVKTSNSSNIALHCPKGRLHLNKLVS